MLARGIEPLLTLYHWDLPDHLQQIGGWTNSDVQNLFSDYAALVMERYGNRVKYWATHNEPWCSSFLSFDLGIHAPGKTDRYEAMAVGKGLLMAHGKAIKKMREINPSAQLGIVINPIVSFPHTSSERDQKAAEIHQAELNDFWFDPLNGKKPPECLDLPNLSMSDLFKPEDLDLISQPIDFVGVNYYTRAVIEQADNIRGYEQVNIPNVERTHIGWEVYPEGLEQLLKELQASWPMPTWFITENGAATDDVIVSGKCEDAQRQRYFQTHLGAVDRAISSGVPVKGYYAWSLMDNFEWAFGYSQRFGIVYVDYETQERYPKGSALAFKNFLLHG
jgi:beta-glucosidase